MIRRCNAAGVNVIADAVINHMSSHNDRGVGVAGSSYDGPNQAYPSKNKPRFERQNYFFFRSLLKLGLSPTVLRSQQLPGPQQRPELLLGILERPERGQGLREGHYRRLPKLFGGPWC